jgi:predicted nucleic acid-binding protein
MYTLDANIFVRDADPHDPEHPVCHTLLERIYLRGLSLIVPAILLAEVAGPLSRGFRDPIRARVYFENIVALAHVTLIEIDTALAQASAEIAADYALRGMDAIYVAVAHGSGCTLITLDQEMRVRAAPIVTVRTPGEALAEITPP